MTPLNIILLMLACLGLRSLFIYQQKKSIEKWVFNCGENDLESPLQSFAKIKSKISLSSSAVLRTKDQAEVELCIIMGKNISSSIERNRSFKVCDPFLLTKNEGIRQSIFTSHNKTFILEPIWHLSLKTIESIKTKMGNLSIDSLKSEIDSFEIISNLVNIYHFPALGTLLDTMKNDHDERLLREFYYIDEPHKKYSEYKAKMCNTKSIGEMDKFFKSKQTA